MKYSKFNLIASYFFPIRPLPRQFKNTLLFFVLMTAACGNSIKKQNAPTAKKQDGVSTAIITGAENTKSYFPELSGKRIGIVTNQTGIVGYDPASMSPDNGQAQAQKGSPKTVHLVDFLVGEKFNIVKIFAPEHGFRGTADAGEHLVDGKDTKTGLPIISLYGDNKKPKSEQLRDIDVIVFDLQDVGARFYTYISSLHYVMEACAENNLQLIVLDRPNPQGGTIDGPILEKEFKSFVGMHAIPVLHGMTIGEYAQMINGEKWLANGIQCNLKVAKCINYAKEMPYSLPVKPSPNLPNDKAVNLYPSLCFFEGTNVSVGRGTNKQFQVYGSPLLPDKGFSFVPMPNEGAKEPPLKGQTCYGEDLSGSTKISGLHLNWLLKAYAETSDRKKFFNPFFSKLAGTDKLQKQIEAGMSEAAIRQTWSSGLKAFAETRKKYLLY